MVVTALEQAQWLLSQRREADMTQIDQVNACYIFVCLLNETIVPGVRNEFLIFKDVTLLHAYSNAALPNYF